MPHLGSLRDYEFATEAADIRGSDLYGPDREQLGTIDDVIFDHGTGEIRYVVVAAGGWLDNRKFLLPGDRISPAAQTENDFYAPLSKDQVERLPAFDEKALERSEDWDEYEQKYNLAWEEDPILHIEGTDRMITSPEDAETAPASSGRPAPKPMARVPNLEKEGGVVGRYEPRQPNTMPPLATETHDLGTSELRSPAGTPASEASARTTAAMRQRWREFENALRNNREEILARCAVCHPKSEREVA
jgi:hypothetical protein